MKKLNRKAIQWAFLLGAMALIAGGCFWGFRGRGGRGGGGFGHDRGGYGR